MPLFIPGGSRGGPGGGLTLVQVQQEIDNRRYLKRVASLPALNDPNMETVYLRTADDTLHLPMEFDVPAADQVPANAGWQELTPAVADANGFADFVGAEWNIEDFRQNGNHNDVAYLIPRRRFTRLTIAGGVRTLTDLDADTYLPDGWHYRGAKGSEAEANRDVVVGRNVVFWFTDQVYDEALHFSVEITTAASAQHTERHYVPVLTGADLSNLRETIDELNDRVDSGGGGGGSVDVIGEKLIEIDIPAGLGNNVQLTAGTWTTFDAKPNWIIPVNTGNRGFREGHHDALPDGVFGLVVSITVNGVQKDWAPLILNTGFERTNDKFAIRVAALSQNPNAAGSTGWMTGIELRNAWSTTRGHFFWQIRGLQQGSGSTPLPTGVKLEIHYLKAGGSAGYGDTYFYWANGATERVTDSFPYTQDAAADGRLRLQFKQNTPDERFHTTANPSTWFVAGSSVANLDAGGAPAAATDRVVFQPPAGTWKLKLWAGFNDPGDEGNFGVGLFEIKAGTDDTVIVEGLGKEGSPGLFSSSSRNIVVVESDEIVCDGNQQFYWMALVPVLMRNQNWSFYMRAEKVA